MSLDAMRQVLEHSRAQGTDRTVAAAVAWYAHPETGLAFPSNELLQRQWGFSERAIQVALRALERIGELERQPALESFQRRRVYRIGPGQLSILDELETGAEAHAPADTAPAGLHAPAPRVRVEGSEIETKEKNPPLPPPQAEGDSDRTNNFGQSVPTPRVSARSARAAARRRRRQSRRDEDGACVASGESCPLNALAGSAEKGRLIEVWLALSERLQSHMSPSAFEVWFAGAHLHSAGELLELGVHPLRLAYLTQRYIRALERAIDRPFQVVGCAAISAQQQQGAVA